jgi:hypothetical protein
MVIAQIPADILSEDQSTAGSEGNTEQRDNQNFPSPNALMAWYFFWQAYLSRRLSAKIRHTMLPFPRRGSLRTTAPALAVYSRVRPVELLL